MIRSLAIRNLFLIESVDVGIEAGFITITGETGAGKSTLLEALRLVLGKRTDNNCVRVGADHGSVSARFELDESSSHHLNHVFEAGGFTWSGEELILRRVLKDGKSRTFCNDQPISSALLKNIGDALCEWHGQHDDSLQPQRQQTVLDTWMLQNKPNLQTVLDSAATEHKIIQHIHNKLEALNISQKEATQKALYAEAVLRELDPLAPEENEESHILNELNELQAWNRMKDRLSDVVEQLPTVLKALYNLNGSLSKVVEPEDQRLQTLEKISLELEDVRASYEDDLNRNRHATERLNTLEHRLGQLRHIALKWGVQPDELYTMWQEAKNFSPDNMDRTVLTRELDEHTQAYNKLAEILHKERHEAAQKLATRMMTELTDLHLPHARVEILVTKGNPSATGHDSITFHVSFNPGQPLNPLHKVASGGERARLTLVLRTLLGQERPLLVFDEVDQGVSGATAHTMGQRLRLVGAQQQILAITHSAQVASQAHQHLCVTKYVVKDSTHTQIDTLTPEQRVHEVARLIAGKHITNEAIAAAQKLML